jgi:hypothetical protein
MVLVQGGVGDKTSARRAVLQYVCGHKGSPTGQTGAGWTLWTRKTGEAGGAGQPLSVCTGWAGRTLLPECWIAARALRPGWPGDRAAGLAALANLATHRLARRTCEHSLIRVCAQQPQSALLCQPEAEWHTVVLGRYALH